MNPTATFPQRRRDVPESAPGGFSLVELLVSMTLGLILLGGLITVFSGNRRTSEINAAMISMQENARFALNTIASDIRMAGHQGCLDFNGPSVSTIAKRPPTAEIRDTAVAGAVVTSDGQWATSLALGSGAERFQAPVDQPAIVGTHALAVQFGGPEVAFLRPGGMQNGGVPDPQANLRLDDAGAPLPIGVDDLALISHCEDGELFRVSSHSYDAVNGTTLGHAATTNTRGNFLEPYGSGGNAGQVRVMPFRTHVYYIGDTGTVNDEGDTVRALYQQSMPFNDANNPPVELVRGVENLRLSFGVGRNGGRLRYVTSDDASYRPADVRSVRVGLLMSSHDHVAQAPDATIYTLAGQQILPSDASSDGRDYLADERFRLAFNTTVKVRNRRAAN